MATATKATGAIGDKTPGPNDDDDGYQRDWGDPGGFASGRVPSSPSIKVSMAPSPSASRVRVGAPIDRTEADQGENSKGKAVDIQEEGWTVVGKRGRAAARSGPRVRMESNRGPLSSQGNSKGFILRGRPYINPSQSKPIPQKFNINSSPKSWKDICGGGRKVEEECKLRFIPPSLNANGEHVAKIPSAVV